MNIPFHFLTQEYVEDCKVYVRREELLRHMPKNGIVAELGVYHGDFAKNIFAITEPDKLYLIDYWPHIEDQQKCAENLKNELATGKVEMIEEMLEIALPTFPDYCFDWVYLDACHRYKPTATALAILARKVKRDGIIAGHDFCNGMKSLGYYHGVIPAVYEFCMDFGWKFEALALDHSGHFSFALKRK